MARNSPKRRSPAAWPLGGSLGLGLDVRAGSHLASLRDGVRAFFQTFIDQYGAQIKDGEPDVPGAEEWKRHVRPHGVTGRRYMPQFIQMAGTMMRLGVEAGVVGELARL